MNTNFKSKNHQSQKKSEFYEALITILQSTANLIKIGTTKKLQPLYAKTLRVGAITKTSWGYLTSISWP